MGKETALTRPICGVNLERLSDCLFQLRSLPVESAKRYRPISYLQTNAADVAKELLQESGPLVITDNGVPSFVCLSLDEYHRIQETNALVTLVRMGEQEIHEGKFKTLDDARKELDRRFLKRGNTPDSEV